MLLAITAIQNEDFEPTAKNGTFITIKHHYRISDLHRVLGLGLLATILSAGCCNADRDGGSY